MDCSSALRALVRSAAGLVAKPTEAQAQRQAAGLPSTEQAATNALLAAEGALGDAATLLITSRFLLESAASSVEARLCPWALENAGHRRSVVRSGIGSTDASGPTAFAMGASANLGRGVGQQVSSPNARVISRGDLIALACGRSFAGRTVPNVFQRPLCGVVGEAMTSLSI